MGEDKEIRSSSGMRGMAWRGYSCKVSRLGTDRTCSFVHHHRGACSSPQASLFSEGSIYASCLVERRQGQQRGWSKASAGTVTRLRCWVINAVHNQCTIT